MPHLVKMERRYSKKGFVLLGAESQQSSSEEVEKVVKNFKIKHSMVAGASGPVDFKGLPYMVIFDSKGKLIYSGRNNDDEERAIRKALREMEDGDSTGDADDKDALRTLVEERTWTSADGRELKAALVKLSGDIGTFRRPDGRTFDYDISKLSQADQKLIQESGK